MAEVTVIALGLLAFYFWIQHRIGKQLILQFESSIREGNTLILERPMLLNKNFPLELCQRTLDENATIIRELEKNSNQTNHAFNEILGGMLDGALILDQDHGISFANSTAERNFSLGQSMIGRRLEAFVDSFEVLDLIDQLNRGNKPLKTEFTFRRNGMFKDFEVAYALLSPIRSNPKEVYLLLFREVTEIKRAERLRKDFVANASHELRTPVTMIKGFAEALVDSPDLPEQQRSSFISKIHKNSLRLQTLVDDLLSLSELEGSRHPINLTTNKLCEVIRGIDMYLQDKSYVNKDKLKFSFAEEKDGFPFDAIKVAIAIGNLIDNAFKYAGNFSEVRVSTSLSEGGEIITCLVEDDGIGIPAKDLEYIFERFYVVDKGRSREKGGTGLGLSIVKHVAEAHGGNVHVRSQLGNGSTFSIDLPRFQL
jgi:two-component system phosphate regulon sensor histidine kinase PhoR|tara:strand:+ start:5728 stop:7002 length:1275 start_codon:yes stop_codon:yes gene_type:complete